MKRPPYALALAERLAAGWRPTGGTIWIAAGPAAWDTARGWAAEPGWRAFIALPDEGLYDLAVVSGFECVVLADSLAEAEQSSLARSLLDAGASLVVVIADGCIDSHRYDDQSPAPRRSAA